MSRNYQPAAIQQPAAGHGQAVSQATSIEQARAVAEVQAAVIVAQQVPRDMIRAEAEMKDVCGRMSMAARAFYSVPNRGTGPTVHLMRELARIWGNVQHGVHELARDDDKGESEIEAWAWDVQANTRSSRSFIVPHARMKGRDRQKLTDLSDIYLMNQNIGARAVRECIATVLPTWFTEAAQDACRATLDNGEGVPVEQRISSMLGAFRDLGIEQSQLEDRSGKRRPQWTPGDVAQLGIDYRSITRDGIPKDELFPPVRITTDDLPTTPTPVPEPVSADPAPVDRDSLEAAVLAAMDQAGITDVAGHLSQLFGDQIAGLADLTPEELTNTLNALTAPTKKKEK